MNTSHVATLLQQAKLPSLTDEQLDRLDAAGARKRFEASLLDFACGDAKVVGELELVVRSLSPTLPATFADLGLQFDLASVIEAAREHGRQLFAALHAYRTKPDQRDTAACYLRSLNLGKAAAGAAAPARSTSAPYYSFKIHGQRSALCISEALTRGTGQHTVQIEGAGVLGEPGPGARYDWASKIIIQCTTAECYQLLALLERMTEKVVFAGHGAKHDKVMEMEWQNGHYFVKVVQKGRAPVALKARPVDVVPLSSLLYKQILLNEPHLDSAQVRHLLSQMTAD